MSAASESNLLWSVASFIGIAIAAAIAYLRALKKPEPKSNPKEVEIVSGALADLTVLREINKTLWFIHADIAAIKELFFKTEAHKEVDERIRESVEKIIQERLSRLERKEQQNR